MTDLLVDFDGVVRHWPKPPETFSGVPTADMLAHAFEPALLGQVITGKISDREWRRAVAEKLNNPMAQEAVAEWSAASGEIDWDLLDHLHSNYRLHLVTNATDRLSGDLDTLKVRERFSRIFNSSEMGVAKPSPDYFAAVLRSLDLLPADVFYVDDAEQNVRAAQNLGIRSHLFKGTVGLKAWLATLIP